MKMKRLISTVSLLLCMVLMFTSCEAVINAIENQLTADVEETNSVSQSGDKSESSDGANSVAPSDTSDASEEAVSNASSDPVDSESSDDSDEAVNQVNKNEFQGVTDGASVADLYDYCIDSCVSIVCTVIVKEQGMFGYTSYETTSLGSGFVIDGGYIVTNQHVVDGAINIKVVFNDNEEVEATLVGSDKTCDIAVLKLDSSKTVYPVKIGDSSALRIGEDVIAIGTPSDIAFAGTLTYGVISGLNRKIEITDTATGKVTRTMYLIQTDATLNPGNSGGPLFNMKGEVIGINNMKLIDSYEGIGFSIPINGAMQIIDALIEGKEIPDSDYAVTSAYLGITGATVSAVKEDYNLGDNVPDGVLVISVERGSSTYKAGLSIYDVITKFEGVTITTIEELKTELAKHNAGKEVTIEVYRPSRDGKNGEIIEMTFVLDAAE